MGQVAIETARDPYAHGKIGMLRKVDRIMKDRLQTMPSRGGLRRWLDALRYSIAGIKACWRKEPAFRQEVAFAVLMIPGSFWLGTSAVERILLAGSVLLVLIMELLNSAIEAVVDRVGKDPHSLSGFAKDVGSAAVLLSLVIVWLTWGMIAWERFSPG